MDRRFLIGGGVIILIVLAVFMLSRGQNEPMVPLDSDASTPNGKQLYTKAQQLKRDGDFLTAQDLYQEIVVNYPDTENIASIQKEYEDLNMNILFSKTPVPDKTIMHEVKTGDTLGKLAKKYNTTVEFIKKSNNLKSDVIRIGQKLRVWTGAFNVLIDKSQNILILKDGNRVLKVYTVSTGENNCTPVGEFEITTKLIDPVWFNRGVIVPPESPQNVLGTRWLGFDIPGYGIHGTTDPESIGHQVTAGCVRMVMPDVEELYSILPKGTKVVIVD